MIIKHGVCVCVCVCVCVNCIAHDIAHDISSDSSDSFVGSGMTSSGSDGPSRVEEEEEEEEETGRQNLNCPPLVLASRLCRYLQCAMHATCETWRGRMWAMH